ncbi:MAG: hypothetical protein SFZ03_02840 [Candidatus Melainabacteria bacterium]|nr:hypothetical protein [Candidatus Melainabacteria bacterium]
MSVASIAPVRFSAQTDYSATATQITSQPFKREPEYVGAYHSVPVDSADFSRIQGQFLLANDPKGHPYNSPLYYITRVNPQPNGDVQLSALVFNKPTGTASITINPDAYQLYRGIQRQDGNIGQAQLLYRSTLNAIG